MTKEHQPKVDHAVVGSSKEYHLFLCPKKALGMPVRMRIPPSTPNPGSSLVSSRIGAGELVAVGETVGVPVEENEGEYV